MATIEERADAYAKRVCEASADKYCYAIGYYNGATEQDRIARAEERERCINAAQELVCKKCFDNSAIGCRHANDVAKCELLIELREALEGGEG